MMRQGIVIKSFSDGFHRVRGNEGDVVEIPGTADWVEAGLVTLIEPERPQRLTKRSKKRTATAPVKENAAEKAAKKK